MAGEKLRSDPGSDGWAEVLGADVDGGGEALFASFKILADEGEAGDGSDGFGEAEEKAEGEDVICAAAEGDAGGGEGPGEEGGGVDPLDADAVDEGAGGELEEAVGPEEGGEEHAHGAWGEVEVAHDGAGGDGEVAAVDVGDDHAGEEEGDGEPAAG